MGFCSREQGHHGLMFNGTGSFLLCVGRLTSQQHDSVSRGKIYSANCERCHTEIEAADQNFYLTQSGYTDIGPTSPNAEPVACQRSMEKAGIEPQSKGECSVV